MEPVQPAVKQSYFLVTMLSILLLISCLIAGFFAYQTQKLVKELTLLKVSPTPVTTTPSPDPNSNWITYTNTTSSYTISYPKSIIIDDAITPKSKRVHLSYQLQTDTEVASIDLNEIVSPPVFDEALSTFEGQIGDVTAKCQSNKIEYRDCWIKIPDNQKYISIKFYLGKNEVYDRAMEQIISTFKFIEPEASAEPVACTMDAKICPNGSAVGRSGPKCEFAPCPTPNN